MVIQCGVSDKIFFCSFIKEFFKSQYKAVLLIFFSQNFVFSKGLAKQLNKELTFGTLKGLDLIYKWEMLKLWVINFV